ncbi:hypothetical protein FVR03_21060 [Pontibacter qinzhouensis]|uniref:SLC13/DASS family transporter n=1 Tax=Pontibacter qinzhouensis TaxID=2603253 RepID=A0A5C8IZZ7_9BACT|nr:anion permease [Pontibacter qinzhouensis]TXK27721.1 hypothetical protein FVR03_21060 [Pontibacter qinzhouensis]
MLLAVPVTIASGFASMVPVSTPPIAVVSSSGYVRIFEMVKAGFFLNLISVFVLVAVGLTLINRVYS